MGIASEDVTGDGYPEVYLTSQGDNKLQTLADGPAQPTYEDIALDARGHRPPALHRRRRAAVDGVARRVRRRQQRRLPRPVRRQGQRRGPARLRHSRPEQPAASARPTARSSKAPRPRGSSATSGPAAAPSSTSTSTGCSTSSSSTASSRSRCGATSAPATATSRQRWATGSPCGCASRHPTSTPSGRGWRCGSATARSSHEVTVGGGHASGQLGWIHVGLGDADAAEVRVQWPDGEIGPWMDVRGRRVRDHRAMIERP